MIIVPRNSGSALNKDMFVKGLIKMTYTLMSV